MTLIDGLTMKPNGPIAPQILRSTRPAELLMSRLFNVMQTSPTSWQASCPAHDDSTPSLSITERPDLAALIYCHAGCPTPDVLDAIGLAPAHLFPAGSRPSPAAQIVPATPTYSPLPWGTQARLYRAHKALMGSIDILVRLRHEKGIAAHVAELAGLGWDHEHRHVLVPYAITDGTLVAFDRWRFREDRNDSGRPAKAINSRPLYVPATVLAELTGSTLLVAEGPLDALTACSYGRPAVAAPSASTWKADAAEWIASLGYSRHVVIGDCDDAGRRFADRASLDLAAHGLRVGVLDLDAGRHDGWDLGAHLLEHGRLP